MAKNIIFSLNIIVTLFLLFLCTFSSSTRTSFDSSEINNVNVDDIDQTNHDSSFPMSVKNPLDQNSIFLPSENLPEPDSKHATLVQYDEPIEETIEYQEPKIVAPTKTITTTESSKESKTLPLTVFRFGPIDSSRIPRRPSRPSQLSRRPIHHRCHHAHQHYKPWNNRHLPRRPNNVVITKINNDVEGKEFDTVARWTPVDWMRYDNNINDPIMFSRERSKAMENSELLRKVYERYNQRHQEQAEAKVKDNGSTFVKRIRKFLNGV